MKDRPNHVRMGSINLTGVVFSTPRKAPGTLQKEWGDLLEVDIHADMIVEPLKITFWRQKTLQSVTARSP